MIEDLGMTEEEWEALGSDEKEAFAKEIAFDRLEWGFEKLP